MKKLNLNQRPYWVQNVIMAGTLLGIVVIVLAVLFVSVYTIWKII